MKKIYTSKNSIVCMILITLLIFQDWIAREIEVWSYFDEILAIYLFLIAISDRIYNHNFNSSKFDLYAGMSIVTYWFVTTYSSFVFGFQSFDITIKASFLGIKWFIVFWSVKYICNSTRKVSVFKFGSRIIHEVIIIFGIIENCFWLNNINNVFNEKKYSNALSPIYLCAVSVMLITILFMEWKNSKLDWICFGLMLENLIFSTKAKGYAAALLAVAIFVWVIRKKRKIKFFHLFIMGVLSIGLAWKKIYFYYIYASAPDHDYARYRLTATGAQILKDYFPVGTGWGTWGSYYSSVNYSPVYYLYGLDKHHELGVQTQKFMMDSYLASVMGESGFIGLLMIILFMVSLFVVINKLFEKDRRVYAAGLLCLLYLCITFIEETGFANPALIGLAVVMGMIVSKWEMSNRVEMNKNLT